MFGRCDPDSAPHISPELKDMFLLVCAGEMEGGAAPLPERQERAASPPQEPDQAEEPEQAQLEPEAPPAHKPRLIKPTALRASPAAMLTAWVPSLACPGSDPAPAGAACCTPTP